LALLAAKLRLVEVALVSPFWGVVCRFHHWNVSMKIKEPSTDPSVPVGMVLNLAIYGGIDA
jgi:hypothetical protein